MREYTINTPESELNGTKDHYCFKIKYIYITDCRYGYVAAALFVFTAKTNNKKAKHNCIINLTIHFKRLVDSPAYHLEFEIAIPHNHIKTNHLLLLLSGFHCG